MYHQHYISKLMQFAPIGGRHVAVLGCSFGHECRALIDHGAGSVVGFDLDPRIGRDFHDERVQYRRESATDILGSDDEFDVVYSAAVFEHVHDLHGAFSEASRICKPGGSIFIISSPLWFAPFGNHMTTILPNLPWCHLLFKPSELETKIAEVHPEVGRDRRRELLEIIFDPGYFNRLPPASYVSAAAAVGNVSVGANTIWPATANEPFGAHYLGECLARGFVKSDLLAGGHFFSAVKNP